MAISNLFYNLKIFIKRNVDFSSHYFVLIISIVLSPYLIYVDFINQFFTYTYNITHSLLKGNPLVLFFIDFSISVIPVLIIFLFGLSLIGFLFSYINTFFLGIVITNAIAYFYISFGSSGIYYCFGSVIPKLFLYLVIVLFANRESYVFSRMICKSFIPGKSYNFNQDFKIYFNRFLVFIIIILSISILSILKIHLIK